MSRIGKKIIGIPKNVSIHLENDLISGITLISVQGQFGILEQKVKNTLSICLENGELTLKRLNEIKTTRSYHGLMRALIQNMVTGVNEKYSKTLIAEGIGYKFQIENKKLIANVGFTNPVQFEIPSDITIQAESPTRIVISGIDKEKVGFLASKIRAVRPPEPYKGKGLLYLGEKIIRKAGKTRK